jgi:hypothetical protein
MGVGCDGGRSEQPKPDRIAPNRNLAPSGAIWEKKLLACGADGIFNCDSDMNKS